MFAFVGAVWFRGVGSRVHAFLVLFCPRPLTRNMAFLDAEMSFPASLALGGMMDPKPYTLDFWAPKLEASTPV